MAIDPETLALAKSIEPDPGATARFMDATEAIIEATCAAAATDPDRGGSVVAPDVLLALVRRARTRLAFAQQALADLDDLLADHERRLVS